MQPTGGHKRGVWPQSDQNKQNGLVYIELECACHRLTVVVVRPPESENGIIPQPVMKQINEWMNDKMQVGDKMNRITGQHQIDGTVAGVTGDSQTS